MPYSAVAAVANVLKFHPLSGMILGAFENLQGTDVYGNQLDNTHYLLNYVAILGAGGMGGGASSRLGVVEGRMSKTLSEISGITDGQIAMRASMLSGDGYLDAVARSHEVAIARIESHYAIRGKYGLPPRDMRFENPLGYIDEITGRAESMGMRVGKPGEFEAFFDEFPYAGGFYDHPMRAIGVPGREASDPIAWASTVEHEFIHGIQAYRYPGLSIRRTEFEAYVAQLKPNTAAEAPNVLAWYLNGSVRHRFKELRGR